MRAAPRRAMLGARRSGGIGRRDGLKHRWGSPPVWVRVPPSAPVFSTVFRDRPSPICTQQGDQLWPFDGHLRSSGSRRANPLRALNVTASPATGQLWLARIETDRGPWEASVDAALVQPDGPAPTRGHSPALPLRCQQAILAAGLVADAAVATPSSPARRWWRPDAGSRESRPWIAVERLDRSRTPTPRERARASAVEDPRCATSIGVGVGTARGAPSRDSYNKLHVEAPSVTERLYIKWYFRTCVHRQQSRCH